MSSSSLESNSTDTGEAANGSSSIIKKAKDFTSSKWTLLSVK